MEYEAVDRIIELAEVAAGQDVMFKDQDGRELTTRPLHVLPKDAAPDEPETMTVHSLQGLVDYVTSNRDELAGAECLVHVASPTLVRVVSKLQDRAKRFVYLSAEARNLSKDAEGLGHFEDLEDVIITLQTVFEDAGERSDVLTLLSNVTDNAEVQQQDDGFGQKVTTRQGLKDYSPVPNPVMLAPFRTFPEIKQPISPFVLRMKRSPVEVALFECDGGAWELQAVESIAAWLEGQVGDFAILR